MPDIKTKLLFLKNTHNVLVFPSNFSRVLNLGLYHSNSLNHYIIYTSTYFSSLIISNKLHKLLRSLKMTLSNFQQYHLERILSEKNFRLILLLIHLTQLLLLSMIFTFFAFSFRAKSIQGRDHPKQIIPFFYFLYKILRLLPKSSGKEMN